MEPRKYSTGTKGRLKMHADQCREAIHAGSPNFSLAVEFIESIDPEKEDRVWQRFQAADDVLPELEAWLSGGEAPAQKPKDPVVPANRLATPDRNLTVRLKDARAWVEENSEFLSTLTPLGAIGKVLERMENRG